MKCCLPFILLISISASAQLQRYDSFAATTTSASGIGNIAQVIPNATLTVFNYPGAGTNCAGGGCVAATTYTSRTGVTTCGAALPLTRPTSTTCIGTADSQGNFGFWAAAGVYQYCVAGVSFTTQCYNVVLSIPLDFSTAGVFTNTQMNLTQQAILNSLNPSSEYQATQGAQFDTEALTGGIAISGGSTVHQVSALAGYTSNSSTATNAVGTYSQSRCLINNSKCWGANMVSADAGSLTTGLTLYGQENDCNPNSPTSAYSGIICFLAIMNSTTTGTVGTAFYANTNHLGSLFWSNAFFANDGSSAIAFNTGAACTTGTCASQPIQFDDFSSNVRSTATLVTDSGNTLVFTGAGMRNATASTTIIPQSTGSLIPQVGSTSQKAETGAADTNVLTVTPPAVAGTYRACFIASVASATAGVISWTLSWTDSSGNAQSNIAQDLFQDGTAAPATTFTTSAAGNYHFCRELDVNNAAASIIVKWVGGGTTAAKVSAIVERLI